GKHDDGVIFDYDISSGVFNKLINFDHSNTGKNSYGSLLLASDNNLYGVTKFGGENEKGVLYKIDPSNSNYSVLSSFDSLTTGSYPECELIEVQGKLYGVTPNGGANDLGVIFEFDPVLNNISILHSFS